MYSLVFESLVVGRWSLYVSCVLVCLSTSVSVFLVSPYPPVCLCLPYVCVCCVVPPCVVPRVCPCLPYTRVSVSPVSRVSRVSPLCVCLAGVLCLPVWPVPLCVCVSRLCVLVVSCWFLLGVLCLCVFSGCLCVVCFVLSSLVVFFYVLCFGAWGRAVGFCGQKNSVPVIKGQENDATDGRSGLRLRGGEPIRPSAELSANHPPFRGGRRPDP